MSIKIILFDADGTLWDLSKSNDYLSSTESTFIKKNPTTIIRVSDGTEIKLKKHIKRFLQKCQKIGCIMGILSDNKRSHVINVLELFGLKKYFNLNYSHIELFYGKCPKDKLIMTILRILKKDGICILPSEVLFIDDKDYKKELDKIGVEFLQFGKDVVSFNEVSFEKTILLEENGFVE